MPKELIANLGGGIVAQVTFSDPKPVLERERVDELVQAQDWDKFTYNPQYHVTGEITSIVFLQKKYKPGALKLSHAQYQELRDQISMNYPMDSYTAEEVRKAYEQKAMDFLPV